MRRSLCCLNVIIIILAFIIIISFFIFRIEQKNDNPYGDKIFTIVEGESVTQIATKLENEGFIKKPFYFKAYVALKGLKNNFYAGDYKLNTKMSIVDLVKVLTAKKTAKKELKITIIEGWTKEKIADYLETQGMFRAADFLAYLDSNPNLDYEFLRDKPSSATLEGYLYPDTYFVYQDATPAEVVTKMLDNFDSKLTKEMREEIYKQGKTIFEILTLSSIVEKEMFGYENRQIVAGIFWQRLKDHYPLQSDATVNYITKKGTTRPSFADTKIENPYNTYKNVGLPPGPICNPSIEAIKATIYPKMTDYYFFLTTKDNQIIFSRNLDEHLNNINKYLD